MKGIFLSHHDGFINIMSENFKALPGVGLEIVRQPFNLPIGFEARDKLLPLLPVANQLSETGFPEGVNIANLRNEFQSEWNRIKNIYINDYKKLCDWSSLDYVIIGLGAFNYDIIRSIRPDIPIIYYPRMFTVYWENLYINADDPKFTYVIHDEEMEKYPFPANNKKFIMSSLNPEVYHSWTGEINEVATIFHNLDLTVFEEINEEFKTRNIDWLNKRRVPENSYPKIIDDIPHQLFGVTVKPGWMGAKLIPPHDIHKEIRKYRCCLIYSRVFSAIATAQLLATGVPSVGFVTDDNELHKLNGDAISISRNIDECKELINRFIDDYSYARDISIKTREAYYKRHNWEMWKTQWTELIHSVVN